MDYDFFIDFRKADNPDEVVWLYFKVNHYERIYKKNGWFKPSTSHDKIDYDIVRYKDDSGTHEGSPPYELYEDDHEIDQYVIRTHVGESYRD